MGKSNLQVLTKEEKDMAEKYHNYIYYFLRRKGYSIEEYYDIVVMGYLKAVQKYCRDDNLKLKWSFTTICEHDMWREIGNEAKKEKVKSRVPKDSLVSLNVTYQSENSKGSSFENAIVLDSFEEDLLCEDTVERILNSLSETQRKIILLKLQGYQKKEIKSIINISLNSITKELNAIRETFKLLDY